MRFIRYILLSLALLLATPAWADVVITEFLASNQNGLLDEDGATSDWIELYNDGAAPVNLSGWRFTDDSADLFKWTFPAATIEPKGFLIVFASNKNRAVATAPLHTNFKLNSDGGYLALVRPDTTFSTVFNPYPAQYDDKPYGFAQTVTTTQLLSPSSAVKFFIPTSATPDDATWTARTFNDASWTSATAGIGFDSTSASGYAALIGASGNCQTAMMNNTPSAYARFAFSVANPATVTSLTMPIKYDDGFVAYLNGVEVARRNAPAGVTTNTTAATANHVAVQAKIYESIDLTPHVGLLVASGVGSNILAIHGLNETAASTDFLIKVELDQYSVTISTTEGYYATATAGAFNTAAVYNKVAPVLINIGRGIYTTAQSVTLSCSTPGATIRYTYDGSSPFQLTTAGAIVRDGSGNPIPSPTSGVYSTPLSIGSTKTLRYAAFKNGSDPSDSVTQTYLFLSDVITQSPSTSGSGAAPAITNPPGASPATTTWPSSVSSGQILDYGIDPNVTTAPAYSATILNDMKAIPSISIVTDLPFLFDNSNGIYSNPNGDTITWERAASVELISKTGTSEFQANCGLRLRGGFSRSTGNPKHGFRLFFRDTYGPSSLNYALFGSDPTAVTKFDKFDLRCTNNYSWSFGGDAGNGVFVRDIFNRQTQLDMGQLSSHTIYYHLYLNGQYWGLYNVDERPEANFGASYLGGDSADYDTIKSAPDLGYTNYATDGDEIAWQSLWSQADSGLSTSNTEIVNNTNYQKIIGKNPNGTANPAFPVLVEADGLIDYCLCIYWGGNLDASISAFLGNNNPNNWFGFRDRTGAHGGFRFVLHDSEHTLLNVNENRTGPWPAGSSISQGGSAYSRSSPQYIFQQLIKAQQFKMLFADRVYKHFANGGALTPAVALARFNALTTEIDRAIVGESARWGNSKTTPSLTRNDHWLPATNNVRNNFFPNRTANVLGQFRAQGWYPTFDPPLWSQRGGTINSGSTITLSIPAGQSGTIYYTIDGTDPRSYNSATGTDGIAGTALVYSGPITIPNSRTIRTRVRNATTWSAIDEATFYTPQDFTKLVVSEINYNPTNLGAVSGDEFEFLELKNIGAVSIDLGGCTFTNGIVYTFPNGTFLAPGGFSVLVRDTTVGQTNFHTRYPGVLVSGIYTGKLNNGGETITLANPTGGTIFSLTYSNALPWPVSADGNGFTAVPKNTIYNSDSGVNWRGSANIFGSPGVDDPAVTTSVVINEILTNSQSPFKDTIELHNPTNASVNVGYWWLTDDPNVPKKYQIAAGTVIPAGGFVVFDETHFNPTPGVGLTSFALNSAGDDVYLFSGDAGGNLTGYSHGFAFAGAELNVSFGRIVTTAGDEYFPRQISRTFSAQNSGPLVGPLVINEVMYHPFTGYDEFVEIRNISGSTVLLYDPANPANTWKVGGLAYTFAASQSIPAGGYALVVGIAPATFRSKYNVPMSVQIFGPFTGAIQDNGERISLEMPDTPILNGLGQTVVPYDIIDTVRYNNIAPWPTAADGAGPSLQRTNSSAFGDDPANWFADGITGGFPNAINQPSVIAITAPVTNSPYTAPAVVTFTSAVSDPDGSIIKVEYFSGINKLGESTTGPNYTFAWTSTPDTHTITAKATDNSLGVTTSAPITVYVTSAVTQGLKGDYYPNKTLTAPIVGTRTDAFSSTNAINFNISSNPVWPTSYGFPSLGTTNFSVRWSGQILATKTGNHTFSTIANDGTRLFVNGNQIINNWVDVGDGLNPTSTSSSVAFTIGQLYDITLEYYQNIGTGSINLKWVVPSSFQSNVPQTALYPDSVPIIVNQPAGIAQVETLAVNAASGATSSGNLFVTVTSALIPTTTVSVPLIQGTHNTATLIASAIAASLNAHPVVGSKFTASNNIATITLTTRNDAITPNYDVTLNVAIAAGLGVSAVNTSTDGTSVPVTSLTKDQGTPATFTVLASGHNLSYQWRKNGVFIPGATSQTYTISYCQPGDAAQYSVFVINTYGFAVSNNSQLTVTFTDTDGDGIQNYWETANGLNPNSNTDAALDNDGDGYTNLQEFLAGTNPNDPNSKFNVTIAAANPSPGYTLTFTAQPYKSYTIQYKDSLTAPSWTTLQTYPATPAQQTITYTDPAGHTARFYRVATP